ncbi:MAG: lysophospholipid acyltransferase family protein [Holophagales bacterium]|nr:lysophospholipid acyltransferase family protein [Holophagales bacterium]
MKNAPVRHALEYFFYRRFARAILRRPHAEVRAFGARLGRWGHRLLIGPRRLALANLERVFPEMPRVERRRVVRACFEHFGSHFCEAVSFDRFDAHGVLEQFDVEGWEVIEELEREDGGFFLHAGHFGCFEMALYPLSIRLERFYALGRPPDNPRVGEDLLLSRQRFGAVMIEKAGAARQMRRALRQGGRIALVIDQHVRESAGIHIPFLGHPASTSPVLALLALRHRAPVVPFTCWPARGGRYRLEIRRPLRPEGEGDQAVADLTRQILAEVETDIRQRPELWLWMHRRWRTSG